MFKRILLCYDGSEPGRAALKHGAELAIYFKSEVHLLLVLKIGADPALVASAAGYTCLVDDVELNHTMVAQSVERLRARGVTAHGHVVRGDTIDVIVSYAKSLCVDLIVVGHYPRPSGGRWWAGPTKLALAERVNCSVLIALNSANGQSGASSPTSPTPP
jgi:nucleotide-binding universal stress UspA family protein